MKQVFILYLHVCMSQPIPSPSLDVQTKTCSWQQMDIYSKLDTCRKAGNKILDQQESFKDTTKDAICQQTPVLP